MKDALGYEKKNQPTTDNIQTIASPCFLFKIQVQLIVHLYFCSTAENWQRNYCNHISGQWKWRSVINSKFLVKAQCKIAAVPEVKATGANRGYMYSKT